MISMIRNLHNHIFTEKNRGHNQKRLNRFQTIKVERVRVPTIHALQIAEEGVTFILNIALFTQELLLVLGDSDTSTRMPKDKATRARLHQRRRRRRFCTLSRDRWVV
jgi:hypothetical protein